MCSGTSTSDLRSAPLCQWTRKRLRTSAQSGSTLAISPALSARRPAGSARSAMPGKPKPEAAQMRHVPSMSVNVNDPVFEPWCHGRSLPPVSRIIAIIFPSNRTHSPRHRQSRRRRYRSRTRATMMSGSATEHEIGAPFTDHHDGRIEVAAHDRRHDGAVRHPQVVRPREPWRPGSPPPPRHPRRPCGKCCCSESRHWPWRGSCCRSCASIRGGVVSVQRLADVGGEGRAGARGPGSARRSRQAGSHPLPPSGRRDPPPAGPGPGRCAA